MRLLIIHLSDIHYREGANVASERVRLIPAAIQNVDLEIVAVLVICSGDIAFSGRHEEYEIAKRDINYLLSEIRNRFKNTPVHFAAVPGNHDCDFTNLTANTRSLILQGLMRGTNPPPDNTTLKICCAIQDGFFSFLEATQTIQPSNFCEGVYYEYLIPVGNGHALVRCFNTAFASTKPEHPGQLVYPVNLLIARSQQQAPLYTVAVFHHPYNWLTPETKHQFGDHVEQSADLILTGHEHRTAY